MRVVSAIAINTAKECLRDKTVLVISIIAFVIMCASWAVHPLALGEGEKLTKDLGLGVISFFSLLVAIFSGTRLVYDEVERKSIYSVLSKPVRRWEFLLGKFLGLSLVIFGIVVILSVLFYVVQIVFLGSVDTYLLLGVFFIYLELVLVAQIALLFSSFATPIPSALFTFALWFVGRASGDLLAFAKMLPPGIGRYLFYGVYYIVPNLSSLNISGMVVHHQPVPPEQIIFAISYTLLYITALFCISVFIFDRREF